MQTKIALLLAAVVGGCVPFDDEVAMQPAAAVAAAPVAPGLTTGCDESAPTIGRLRGRVYPLATDTRRLPDFASLAPAGDVCLDRLDVSERRGYPSFPGIKDRYEWFGVDVVGAFVVATPGTYSFRLASDDGSKLIIDGALVIDNDGYHATRVADGSVALAAGTHTIEVPYWQGPGPLALSLEVARTDGTYEVFRADRAL